MNTKMTDIEFENFVSKNLYEIETRIGTFPMFTTYYTYVCCDSKLKNVKSLLKKREIKLIEDNRNYVKMSNNPYYVDEEFEVKVKKIDSIPVLWKLSDVIIVNENQLQLLDK